MDRQQPRLRRIDFRRQASGTQGQPSPVRQTGRNPQDFGAPGHWTVVLEEPQNASSYRVEIEGPSFKQRWTFDGRDEQQPDFIRATIRKRSLLAADLENQPVNLRFEQPLRRQN